MRGYIASLAVFGDSITEGMTPYLPDAGMLAGARRVAAYSVSGSSAKDWATTGTAKRIVDAWRPNIGIVALGTNVQERDEYQYAGMVLAVYEDLQHAGGVEVYAVGPFAGDDDGRRFGALRRMFGDHALSGYGLADGLPRAGEGNVHFTEPGYEALAARLVAQVRPAIVRAMRPGRSILGCLSTLALSGTSILLSERWVPYMLGSCWLPDWR